MTENNVQVAVRCRPFSKGELAVHDAQVVSMRDKQTIIRNPETGTDKVFTFDHSLWSLGGDSKGSGPGHSPPVVHSQADVFARVGERSLDSAMAGYNTCIFAYGQTGSGKTYTMMGTPQDPGVIPRLCTRMFAIIDGQSGGTVTSSVEMSYMEIYNEKVRDLLVLPGHAARILKVREHPAVGIFVENLIKTEVHNSGEVEVMLQRGNAVRAVGETKMNEASSRSHAVFTLHITQADRDPRTGYVGEKTSKINLVDLAGSERQSKTESDGLRLKEANMINKSLTTLGMVISALAERSEAQKTAVANAATAATLLGKWKRRAVAVVAVPALSASGVHLLVPPPVGGANSAESSGDDSDVATASPVLPRKGRAVAAVASLSPLAARKTGAKAPMSADAAHSGGVARSAAPAHTSAAAGGVHSGSDAAVADCKGPVPGASGKGSGARAFVPYRDSVLTWLLKDSLGGNCRTVMVAAISPAASSFGESLSTLRFADRAKAIVNNAIVNEDETARIIRELREELARVRALLQGDEPNGRHQSSAAELAALRRRIEEDEVRPAHLAAANRTWQEKLQRTEAEWSSVAAQHTEKLRLTEQENEQLRAYMDTLTAEREHILHLRGLAEDRAAHVGRHLSATGEESTSLEQSLSELADLVLEERRRREEAECVAAELHDRVTAERALVAAELEAKLSAAVSDMRLQQAELEHVQRSREVELAAAQTERETRERAHAAALAALTAQLATLNDTVACEKAAAADARHHLQQLESQYVAERQAMEAQRDAAVARVMADSVAQQTAGATEPTAHVVAAQQAAILLIHADANARVADIQARLDGVLHQLTEHRVEATHTELTAEQSITQLQNEHAATLAIIAVERQQAETAARDALQLAQAERAARDKLAAAAETESAGIADAAAGELALVVARAASEASVLSDALLMAQDALQQEHARRIEAEEKLAMAAARVATGVPPAISDVTSRDGTQLTRAETLTKASAALEQAAAALAAQEIAQAAVHAIAVRTMCRNARAMSLGDVDPAVADQVDLAWLVSALGVVPAPDHVTVAKHTVAGFLTKLGNVRKSWQRRFFVLDLHTRQLAYYKDATLERCKGGLALGRVVQAAAAPDGTAGQTPLLVVTWERTFHIQCPSLACRATWVTVLNAIAAPPATQQP